jgi:hypothetical protein
MEVDMFQPQGNFYPQSQGNFYPQGGFYPGAAGHIPFANTLYGIPQQTPVFAQGPSPLSNWQQAAQQQAALQQQAIQQLLAHQLAAQQLGAQSNGAWTQQSNLGPLSPALQLSPLLQQQAPQQPHHHLLQQLAQYHYLVGQQLAQLAAQQSGQNSSSPYLGQFIPGQLGASFVPGITMPGATMH